MRFVLIFTSLLLSGCFDFKILKPSLGADDKRQEQEYQQYLAGAVRNDAKAMSKLGDCYFYCLGTEGNLKEAFKWYLLAAKAGDAHANLMVGYFYQAGYAVKSDREKAFTYYQKAAMDGSMSAIARMPEVKYLGRFRRVKNNIDLFALSSRYAGTPEAEQEYYLGLCYFDGKGTKQDVQKGLELMNSAAKRGCWEANLELANIYFYGGDVPTDEKKALNYAKKAAKQIGALGIYRRAYYERYLKTIEDAKNDTTITNKYELDKFNVKINKIISLFDNPKDVEFLEEIKKEENKKAKLAFKKKKEQLAEDAYIKSYEQAANAGFAPAQYEMGNIETEKGNSNAGFAWYEKAVEKGLTRAEDELKGDGYKRYLTAGANYDRDAQFKLGMILLYEPSGSELADGFEFVNLAYENGHPDARLELAKCYFYGRGTAEDKGKAYYFYKTEADNGKAEAQYMLGEYYWNGYATIRKDMISAYSWYYKAAEQKYPSALVKAGVCCLIGYGTKTDYYKAFKLLKDSEDFGEESGFYYLGICYEGGLGVEKSHKKAFEFYSRSESNNKASQLKVALCYIGGIGVQKNRQKGINILKEMARTYVPAKLILGELSADNERFSEAYEWYYEAAEAEPSSSLANYRIGECYQFGGRGVDKSLRQAANYYKQAFDIAIKNVNQWEDNISDLYCLGLCYENGRGTDKNLEKALEYYKQAAAFGYFQDAQDKVKSLQSKIEKQQ